MILLFGGLFFFFNTEKESKVVWVGIWEAPGKDWERGMNIIKMYEIFKKHLKTLEECKQRFSFTDYSTYNNSECNKMNDV